MSRAAPRDEKRSSARASSIGRPRTWSATRRAFLGATRTKRARALTTGRFGASFFGLAAGFASAFYPAAAFVAVAFVVVAFFGWSFFSVFFSSAIGRYSLSLAVPAPEWARKVRVGANSPSLWPTIDSEM